MAYFVWVSVFGKPSPIIVERWPYDTLNDGGLRDMARTIGNAQELSADAESRWQARDRRLMPELCERHPCPPVAKES